MLPERFWSKVAKTNECWLWTAALAKGYGQFWWDGKVRQAYKVAWEDVNGPVPEGMHLDHRCDNRACVNPDHIRPMTQRENILRGTGPTAVNARKKACRRGHDLSQARVWKGRRICRKCEVIANRKYRQRAR